MPMPDLDDASQQPGNVQGNQTVLWRFLVDESASRDLHDALLAASYDSEYGRDVGLRSQPDTVVFSYAQREKRTILTYDKGQGGIVAYPPPHAGIIVARFPNQMATALRVQIILARLSGLAGTDFTDQVVIIDPRRVRVRHT